MASPVWSNTPLLIRPGKGITWQPFQFHSMQRALLTSRQSFNQSSTCVASHLLHNLCRDKHARGAFRFQWEFPATRLGRYIPYVFRGVTFFFSRIHSLIFCLFDFTQPTVKVQRFFRGALLASGVKVPVTASGDCRTRHEDPGWRHHIDGVVQRSMFTGHHSWFGWENVSGSWVLCFGSRFPLKQHIFFKLWHRPTGHYNLYRLTTTLQ